MRAGVARGTISKEQEKTFVRELSEAPRYANQVLKLEEQIERVARELSRYFDVLYLGRDTNSAGHGRRAKTQGISPISTPRAMPRVS